MDYGFQIRRGLISVFYFSAVAMWFLFLYFKLWEFINAAIQLNYFTVQTVSFMVYSAFLLLLPSAFVFSPPYSKKNLFLTICYGFSLVLAIGAIGDMITYKLFIDYFFMETDAIFCNIIFGIPNMYGVLLCFILSAAYALFGFYLQKNKYIACAMYFLIFILSFVPSFVYSYYVWNGFPRLTWIEKAAFIVPQQTCILLSLILSATSDVLWGERAM